jgi:hypothetical protein
VTPFCGLIETHGRVECNETSEGCFMINVLYYGDNLAVSLDSPPFNSNASYNVLFKARPVRDRRRNPQS